MTVILTPLLSAADLLLDRLWRARMVKEAVLLLPDWMDCALPDLSGSASDDEAQLRDRLCRIGRQLADVGLVAATRAVLARGGDADRQAQLLALAGSADWCGDGAVACRSGADGALYTLHTVVTGAAPHAQHAALALSQSLRVEAETVSAEICLPVASRCLSLACAMRDVVLQLVAVGETGRTLDEACNAALHRARPWAAKSRD